MRFLSFIIASLMCFLSLSAEEIRGTVLDKATGQGVPFATLTIEYADTTLRDITDAGGKFRITPVSFPMTVRAYGFGMKENSITLAGMPYGTLTVPLEPGETELQELTVTGRLTTMTDSGISYNMAANRRAQEENSLQALSYVPMVRVSPDGTISVQGSPSFSIYIDGRPDEMLQASPKTFLETIPASDIARVEVITRQEIGQGADSKRYILNIVLKRPMLEGYAGNVRASADTQPNASGSVTGMARRNRVDISASYDYRLNGQRDQPFDVTYTQAAPDGHTAHQWRSDGHGDGNWHTHTMRAMAKWRVDSVNTLYADIHGRIRDTDFSSRNIQSEIFPDPDVPATHLDSKSRYTTGTVESNLIFRNYFRDNPDAERFSAGCRFTYNPDRRHVTQRRHSDGGTPGIFIQHTDGGMTEHTLQASYLQRISPMHSVRLTASDVYRRGRTNSAYEGDDDAPLPDYAMRYYDNIAAFDATYAGWIRRKVYVKASAKGNFDSFSMRLPGSPESDYHRDRFYFLPAVTLFWRHGGSNAVYLDYATAISRPGVEQLNPFVDISGDHSASHGNPDLKAQYAHNMSLLWYFTGARNLVLATSVRYSRLTDMILPSRYVDGDMMIRTYGNFGSADETELTVNASWDPVSWVSVSLNGSLGKRWLGGKSEGLRQDNLFCSISPDVDFYLPNHFRAGCSYGFHKNLPDPWSTCSSLHDYSLYVSRSFMKGRINLTVTANSPFNLYRHSRSTSNHASMSTVQNNYMTARSFGLSLSYSFRGGRKVDLKRDSSLKPSDQETGVR